MKVIQLKKFGATGEKAFQVADIEDPKPGTDDVLVQVDAFGLNFADVMARKGIYNDCPPLPAVLGYESVGTVLEIGKNVETIKVGDRVVAFTRFGSYAEKVVTPQLAVAKIPVEMSNGEAVAMATQYCTAWFSGFEAINVYPGEHVLIHAAAGGVGTALVQLLKWKKAVVYGTASSEEKLEYLRSIGVDFPINYKENDFVEEIKKINGGKRCDVIFDPIGGSNFKKSLNILAYGGRIVPFGASSREKKGILSLLKVAFGFGFHSPVSNIMKSQIWAGVNMLRIADEKPELMNFCMNQVIDLYKKGICKPHVGGIFKSDEIGKALDFLESRKSMGKIVVEW